MGAGGVQHGSTPLEGQKTGPQGAERDMRARVGVVIWATDPKQGSELLEKAFWRA